jgi:hypothetical protein
MNTTIDKPTIRELRAEAQRLGITAESAGCSVEELIRAARSSDDPLGYLAIYAPSGEDVDVSEDSPTPHAPSPQIPAAAEPIGDVPAPLPPPVEPAKIKTVVIEVPLVDADLAEAYLSRHVEARLSRDQAENLRKLFLALDAGGARLANGRRVIRAADALKWLLEQIG